jgi:hypothetical protein
MKSIYKSIIAWVMMFGFFSCGDDILDINKDPNNPGTSTPQLTLPAGQVALAVTLEADYNLMGAHLAQYWTQGPTASQFSFLEQYNITTNSYNGAWSRMYASALEDLEFVRKAAIEDGTPNYAAIAMLLQAYSFQILVDLYDQIPYTEALQGKDGLLEPKFDDGEAVYDDLIVKIDAALDLIDISSTAVTPVGDDLIYGGNMRKWISFGNTLKLKIYIRQSEARPSVAQAGIQAMYDAGATFLTPGNDALVSFTPNTNNQNPLWQILNQTTFQNIVASATSIQEFINNADDRISAYYDVSPNTNTYVGLPQGKGTTSGDQFADFSAPDGNTVINADADVILISGYESLFLQAEAAERGWGTGDPKSLYDQAVMASFSFHGLDGSALVSPGGNYEYDGELSTIYYQKWLAFNGKQGFEGWNEWRRTGVPVLSPSLQGQALPNTFPLRLIWPANETSTNPNAPELEALDAPVWWDKTF